MQLPDKTMAPNPSVDVNLICEDKVDDKYDFEYELIDSGAADRVRKIVDNFGSQSVTVLTSFGVQSGVMLALGKFAHTSFIHR